MSSETKIDPLDNERVNTAASEFKKSVSTAKKIIESMSRNSLSRVHVALMEFPLGEKEPKFKEKTEQDLFILTLTAMAAKNVMMEAVMQNRKEMEGLLKEAEDTFKTLQKEGTNG